MALKVPETVEEFNAIYENLKAKDLPEFKKVLNERYFVRLMPVYAEAEKYDLISKYDDVSNYEFMMHIVYRTHQYTLSDLDEGLLRIRFILDVIFSDPKKYSNLLPSIIKWNIDFSRLTTEEQLRVADIKCRSGAAFKPGWTTEMLEYAKKKFLEHYIGVIDCLESEMKQSITNCDDSIKCHVNNINREIEKSQIAINDRDEKTKRLAKL